MTAVSAIVVTYFTGDVLDDCLASLRASPEVAELIVIENGSGPVEREIIARHLKEDSRVRHVESKSNVGFSVACNEGARMATADLLLFINPDCVVPRDALARIAGIAGERGGHWCATPRLIDPNGTEQVGARRNEPTPSRCFGEALATILPDRTFPARLRINLNTEPLPDEPFEVEAMSGSFMLMPRATFEAVGGFDENYFLHFEDVDLCLRLKRIGARLLFIPSINVLHLRSTSLVNPLVLERRKARGLWVFYTKFYGDRWPKLVLRVFWAFLATPLIVRGLVRTLARQQGNKQKKGRNYGMA